MQAAGMSQRVCGFMRSYKKDSVLVAVPRFTTALTESGAFPLGTATWGTENLRLPRGAHRKWTNVLTGERIELRSRSKRLRSATSLVNSQWHCFFLLPESRGFARERHSRDRLTKRL